MIKSDLFLFYYKQQLYHAIMLTIVHYITSTCLNPVWCKSSVCPHGVIVSLLQPATTKLNLPQTNVMLIQCVSPWSQNLLPQPTTTCLDPVWCWSSVCPHRAVVHPLQLASTQYDVGPVCVPIEQLLTYFNLPQPNVVIIQCVPIEKITANLINTSLPFGHYCSGSKKVEHH